MKWAGGKGQLLEQYAPLFPTSPKAYYEPFLGGGAVFFRLQPRPAFLSDINQEIVSAYIVVRDRVEELIERLRQHSNEKAYYYAVREQDPTELDPAERAARLIYLNKTCYNGLYRVNRRGRFNVPFGRYRNPLICDAENLKAASLALQGVELRACDFEEALVGARAGDFVYLDPPYDPLSATASFTSYARGGFGEAEQRRLAAVYRELDRRGCLLMLSNADTELVRRLYEGYPLEEVKAARPISCKAEGRGKICELVIRNYWEASVPGAGRRERSG
ncbi:MAG TPA: DNA adenine methylase [Dehalococcoidia bacterium]|nr:DNA adenine methylase [Dehalococcoidia bacterium]